MFCKAVLCSTSEHQTRDLFPWASDVMSGGFPVFMWFAVARDTGCQLQARDKSWRRWRPDATSRVFIVTDTIHRDYPPGSLHFLFTPLQNTVNILFNFLQNTRYSIEVLSSGCALACAMAVQVVKSAINSQCRGKGEKVKLSLPLMYTVPRKCLWKWRHRSVHSEG